MSKEIDDLEDAYDLIETTLKELDEKIEELEVEIDEQEIALKSNNKLFDQYEEQRTQLKKALAALDIALDN